ncbi:hypothetical protein F5X71_23775 [Nocardia brasiliensis]|uniref:Uncharacterized protein n=1 Tax=Nocardia brasiliensis TaxID=37326 RepID=A0A6G9XVJ9_NOCBR|nr:hypothetical protein [Nocardia brasiliensis]QIS04939.1 hypothetical protein F5X71_23775 [Nocardia brasiliensis]
MSEETAAPKAADQNEAFLERAKASGLARLAEAQSDTAAVRWAERTADMLVRRLRDRHAS